MAAVPLRELPDGCRFILARTGERFKLVRRDESAGKCRIIVEGEKARPWAPVSSLNHQCLVIPIVKPHIKPKVKP